MYRRIRWPPPRSTFRLAYQIIQRQYALQRFVRKLQVRTDLQRFHQQPDVFQPDLSQRHVAAHFRHVDLEVSRSYPVNCVAHFRIKDRACPLPRVPYL